MADGKRCAKCGETKPTTEFPPSKQRPDGLFNYCRVCKQEANRAYWHRNADAIAERRKQQYEKNPEPAKARSRKRYREDPERWKREADAWARANPEKRREIAARWQQANMQGLVREAVRRRYATRKGAPSISFRPEQLAQRAAYYGWRCWVCRGEFTEWDHVKPLSRGGWHCLSNLRPICRTCNAVKRDRWPLSLT